MLSGSKKIPQVSTQPDQLSCFKEAARSLGADEDEDAFRAKLGVIARQKPKDEPKAPKGKK